jgi:pseudaminic acid synthase
VHKKEDMKSRFFFEKIKIGSKIISRNSAPFIVAEVSANHRNSFQNIKDIIDKAKINGADAIKFQTFDLDEMTINSKKKIFFLDNYFKIKSWNNRSLYDIYKEAQFPFNLHKKVFDYAKKKKIICFSSVFDEKSLNFLEKIKTPAYKVASLESLHFPLIKKIKKTGKPMIISTGTLKIYEIKILINFLKKIKFKNVILCHCVSEYPAKYQNANLNMIKYLKKYFNGIIGYSDHTIGVAAPVLAAHFGAKLIEKHFINSKLKKTLDSSFSSDPEELRIIKKETYNSYIMSKKIKKNIKSFNRKFRRSIYSTQIIRKGEKFSVKNIKIIRPGGGLEPRYYEFLINRRSKKNILENSPIRKIHF